MSFLADTPQGFTMFYLDSDDDGCRKAAAAAADDDDDENDEDSYLLQPGGECETGG